MEPKIHSKDVKLSFDSDTTVKLDENVEITFGVTCKSGMYTFVVKDIRGDAVIKGIRYIWKDDHRSKFYWDEVANQFISGFRSENARFEIQYVIMPKKIGLL